MLTATEMLDISSAISKKSSFSENPVTYFNNHGKCSGFFCSQRYFIWVDDLLSVYAATNWINYLANKHFNRFFAVFRFRVAAGDY